MCYNKGVPTPLACVSSGSARLRRCYHPCPSAKPRIARPAPQVTHWRLLDFTLSSPKTPMETHRPFVATDHGCYGGISHK